MSGESGVSIRSYGINPIAKQQRMLWCKYPIIGQEAIKSSTRSLTPTLHHYRQSHLLHQLSCRAFFFSSTTKRSSDSSPHRVIADFAQKPLPIGVFVDLDNVAPRTHKREDAKKFMYPLLQLGRLINHNHPSPSSSNDVQNYKDIDSIKSIQKSIQIQFQAFGNLATRTFRSQEQKEIELHHQEYKPWTLLDDEFDFVRYAQSGYDASADTLRCGVCGAKAKLSKKRRAKYKSMGFSEEYDMLEQELMRHMEIHDREQKKRIARMNSKKKGGKKSRGLSEKEMIKFQKCNAAQVGLKRGKITGVDKRGKIKVKNRNDLFQVLKEIGFKVKSSDDVDKTLISAADSWMDRVIIEGRKRDDNDKFLDIHREKNEPNEEEIEEASYNGVLVVFSKDGDFVPLLELAKRRRFITVSVTDKLSQTWKIVQSSDIVVGQGLFSNWFSEARSGDDSSDQDADDDDDEYDVFSRDEIDDELDEIERMFRDSSDEEDGEEGGKEIGDGENSFEIRKLDKAPSFMLKSYVSSKDKSVHATSVSDAGLKFMIARQGVQSNDLEGVARWHLADDSVHVNAVEDSYVEGVPKDEIKPTPEHFARDSVYMRRGSGSDKKQTEKEMKEHEDKDKVSQPKSKKCRGDRERRRKADNPDEEKARRLRSRISRGRKRRKDSDEWAFKQEETDKAKKKAKPLAEKQIVEREKKEIVAKKRENFKKWNEENIAKKSKGNRKGKNKNGGLKRPKEEKKTIALN